MPDVTIYSTNFCGFCRAAKALLDKKKIPYNAIDLSGDHQGRADIIEKTGGYRTVPVIFIGDDFIGGFQELRTLSESGELEKRLSLGVD